jgi:hypothetical protein
MGWVQINELWEAIKGLRDSTNSKESLDTSSLDADTPLDADLLSFWDVVDLERKKITWTNFKTLLGLTFEPLLPATPADPSNKFLDGNKAWSAITGFQETLVSGTNIKTINSTSLLGSGDIEISVSDATKLPLAGGTMTGTITVRANSTAAGTAPIKFQDGELNDQSEIGAMEYKDDNLYFSIQTPLPSVAYTSQYPSPNDATTVKATSSFVNSQPYLTTDPSKPLNGTWYPNVQWITGSGQVTNQRFHIDLGAATIINRIYYENAHVSGGTLENGCKNFTLWGSNEDSAFNELTYGTDTNWTQITDIDVTQFAQHSAVNGSDPKYINIAEPKTYRYWAFKIADGWGATANIGIRRIELQYGASQYRRGIILDDGVRLTAGKIPVSTTNGRLIDLVPETELTDELTTITHTAAGTPDYAIQDLVQNTGFGFATKDEGNTVLAVIKNLQIRVNELETKLAAKGIIADAD